MAESKTSVVEHLMITLQKTSYYHDLMYLDYQNNEEAGTEVVVAGFNNGLTKTINVHMDSGIALIEDVLRGLKEQAWDQDGGGNGTN